MVPFVPLIANKHAITLIMQKPSSFDGCGSNYNIIGNTVMISHVASEQMQYEINMCWMCASECNAEEHAEGAGTMTKGLQKRYSHHSRNINEGKSTLLLDCAHQDSGIAAVRNI
jgi:hypothetical protein